MKLTREDNAILPWEGVTTTGSPGSKKESKHTNAVSADSGKALETQSGCCFRSANKRSVVMAGEKWEADIPGVEKHFFRKPRFTRFIKSVSKFLEVFTSSNTRRKPIERPPNWVFMRSSPESNTNMTRQSSLLFGGAASPTSKTPSGDISKQKSWTPTESFSQSNRSPSQSNSTRCVHNKRPSSPKRMDSLNTNSVDSSDMLQTPRRPELVAGRSESMIKIDTEEETWESSKESLKTRMPCNHISFKKNDS